MLESWRRRPPPAPDMVGPGMGYDQEAAAKQQPPPPQQTLATVAADSASGGGGGGSAAVPSSTAAAPMSEQCVLMHHTTLRQRSVTSQPRAHDHHQSCRGQQSPPRLCCPALLTHSVTDGC
jgi:hypothetical protein